MSLVDELVGVRTLRELNDCKDFWQQFEYDSWYLISFTGKQEGRFGWLVNNTQYTKYVDVKATQVQFLMGVPPDVIDQFLQGVEQ